MTPENRHTFQQFLDKLHACSVLDRQQLESAKDLELLQSDVLHFLLWAMSVLLDYKEAEVVHLLPSLSSELEKTQLLESDMYLEECLTHKKNLLLELGLAAFSQHMQLTPDTFYDFSSRTLSRITSSNDEPEKREKRSVELTDSTHFLLLLFLLNPNTVFTIEEIQQIFISARKHSLHLFPHIRATNFRTLIEELRTQLQLLNLSAKDHIITIHRKGYLFFSYEALKKLPPEEYIALAPDIIFIPRLQCVANTRLSRRFFLTNLESSLLYQLTRSPHTPIAHSAVLPILFPDQKSPTKVEVRGSAISSILGKTKIPLELLDFDFNTLTSEKVGGEYMYTFKP